MRIWHKDLISVLPEMQLKGQWRECCLIAKALLENNLNHVLVNRVKDYPSLCNLEEKAMCGGIPVTIIDF